MQKVITHSGSFHADDVFAVATLQLHFGVENIEVIRTRDEAEIAKGDIVVDVGGVHDPERQRFDHHQPGAPVRENGIPYAAFGLIWKEYGGQVAGGPEAADRIEEMIVLPVDAGDTGINLYTLNEINVSPYELYQVISSFAPTWQSGDDKDTAFLQAVEFARGLIQRSVAKTKANLQMEDLMTRVYEQTPDKRVLVFDVPVSAVFAVQFPEVQMVVCPDDPQSNENWTASTVRKGFDTFESRISFPEEWAGLRDEKLVRASGISDAIFCHKARFIFVAGSKEGALEAVTKTLGE